MGRCVPVAVVLWDTPRLTETPPASPPTRTALVALSLLYLQGQVQSPDGKVDCLGIHSSNLLRDSKGSAALSPYMFWVMDNG